jgi:hypothetical protein
MCIGQWLKEGRLNDAEHGAIRTDAHRQREERTKEERRRPSQRAPREAEILSRGLEPMQRTRRAHVLLDNGNVPECPTCSVTRIGWRQTSTLELLRLEIEMVLQLAIEVVAIRLGPEPSPAHLSPP